MTSTTCLLCVLMMCVAMVTAFPGGGPEFSCSDLVPGHGTYHSDIGYTLDHPTSVLAGERLQIRIDGTRPFKGFFIRSDVFGTSTQIGAFQKISNARRRCGNAGLTQTDGGVDKTSKTIYWRAPALSSDMRVQFNATVVQEYTIYSRVLSREVWVIAKTPTTPAPATPKPRPPPARKAAQPPRQPKQTRQNVVDTKQSPNRGAAGGSQADPLVQFSPDERREIKKEEAHAAGLSLTLDPTCGKSHGCFHDCVRGRCTFIVTWVDNGDHVTFDMKKIEPARSDRWLAIGFSEDEHMGDDSVIECVIDKGFVYVFSSVNTGKMNKRMTDTKAGLSNAAGSYVDGVLECSFDKVKKDDFYEELNDLDQDWHLLFADGEAIDGSLFPHDYEVLPVVSPTKVDLQSFAIVGGEGPRFPLVVAHEPPKSAAMKTGCDVIVVCLAVWNFIRLLHTDS